MPRTAKKTPTPNPKKTIDGLLIKVLNALNHIPENKLTRPDEDGHRGLIPSFTMLTRVAFDLAKHIEQRDQEQADKKASVTKMPFEIVAIDDVEEWKRRAKETHENMGKATASRKQSS